MNVAERRGLTEPCVTSPYGNFILARSARILYLSLTTAKRSVRFSALADEQHYITLVRWADEYQVSATHCVEHRRVAHATHGSRHRMERYRAARRAVEWPRRAAPTQMPRAAGRCAEDAL